MRNDAHDELEHVPSLTTDPRDRDDYSSDPHGSVHQPVPQGSARHYPQVERRRGLGTGPLWALIGALVIAFGGLSWWSYQQIAQMQAQLVVTQETFARISEEASGRIQDISGKVVATESSVTTDNEALKLRIKSLDSKLAELGKAQQNIAGQQSGQGRRIDQLAAELKAEQGSATQLAGRLDKLAGEHTAAVAAIGRVQEQFREQLKGQVADVEALKRKGDPSQSIRNLEQDLLVLRSELENRPAPQNNTAEFDAFRAQVTRNLNALQAQVQNLQQQLNTR